MSFTWNPFRKVVPSAAVPRPYGAPDYIDDLVNMLVEMGLNPDIEIRSYFLYLYFDYPPLEDQ